MSKPEKVLAYDPAIDVADGFSKSVLLSGPRETRYRHISQNGNASTNSLSWSATGLGVKNVVSRNMYLKLRAKFTFEANSSGAGDDAARLAASNAILNPADQTGTASIPKGSHKQGLRYFPLHSASQTVQMQLNNENFSFQSKDVIPILGNYGVDIDDEVQMISPASLDKWYNLDDDNYAGSQRNPLNSWLATDSSSIPRGSIATYTADRTLTGNNRLQTITYDVTWYEKVMFPSVLSGKVASLDDRGFFGLNQFNLTYNLADARKMFEVAFQPANGLTGWGNPSVQFEGDQELNFQIYTLPNVYFSRMPNIIRYPYFDFDYKQTGPETVQADQESSRMSFNNFVVGSVPKALYIWCNEQDQDRNDGSRADFYFPIQELRVDFRNTTTDIQSARSFELYNMAMNNGLEQRSWYDYQYGVGAPLKLEFGKDIPLNDDLLSPSTFAEGEGFNISVEVKCKNQTGVPRTLQGRMLIEHEGEMTFEIQHGGEAIVSHKIGLYTRQDMDRVQTMGSSAIVPYQHDNIYGGGFKSLLKKAVKGLDVGSKIVRDIGREYGKTNLPGHQIASTVGNAVGDIRKDVTGKGLSEKERRELGGYLSGGYLTGGYLTGGGYPEIEGGEFLSRNQMRRRL